MLDEAIALMMAGAIFGGLGIMFGRSIAPHDRRNASLLGGTLLLLGIGVLFILAAIFTVIGN